jgi:hypothetical protein
MTYIAPFYFIDYNPFNKNCSIFSLTPLPALSLCYYMYLCYYFLLCFCFLPSPVLFSFYYGLVISRALVCRYVTRDARFWSQAGPCEMSCSQSSTGKLFSSSNLFFPRQYDPTIVTYLLIYNRRYII